jgi:hypothetical protein
VSNVEILSHWYQLVDGLAYSSQEFYAGLTDTLEKRGIPDAKVSTVEHTEGSMGSGVRLYLRVERKELTFDICAAPFGRGFFVSWWLVRLIGPWIGYAVFLLIGGMALWGLLLKVCGPFLGTFLMLVLGPMLLLGFAGVVRRGFFEIENEILAIPVLGYLYNKIFKPFTYYRTDTELMFQSAVHAAVLEVLDGITTAKGVRALSELERKPILREFYGR